MCVYIDVFNLFFIFLVFVFVLVFAQQFHTFSIWMVTHEAGLNGLSVFNKLFGKKTLLNRTQHMHLAFIYYHENLFTSLFDENCNVARVVLPFYLFIYSFIYLYNVQFYRTPNIYLSLLLH